MEPPFKRQRLFKSANSVFGRSSGNQREYYQDPAVYSDPGGEEEDEEEEEEEEEGGNCNPEDDLQAKRAYLDHKLKTQFESIFEKYGRDFDGVGDEIDLYTGEIVVNNGHLVDMVDEKDAGIVTSEDSMRGSETEEVTSNSRDGEIQEEDDADDFSDEDMTEDDMILRGFAQASHQFAQRQFSHEQESISDDSEQVESSRRPRISRSSHGGNLLPSQAEILAQFGPQIGPGIVDYIRHQETSEEVNIEPAWRAPPLPQIQQKKRSKSRVTVPLREVERSSSPENTTSVWATSEKIKAPRSRFTEEENETLLDFVADVRRRGIDLSSHITWKSLEAALPSHNWLSWKAHYKRHFSFPVAGNVEESEVSASEQSVLLPPHIPKKYRGGVSKNRSKNAFHPSRPTAARSTRIRKPVQRDPNIISWSQAVPIIASKDPDGYSELLKDVLSANPGTSFRFNRPTPASSNFPGSHISQKPWEPLLHQKRQYVGTSKEQRTYENHADHVLDGMEDELSFGNAAPPSQPNERAQCPHIRCSDYPSATYRVNRYDGEELSPWCLHLLHVHHTAPFPCGEKDCDRKEQYGFFMQQDLVKHVRDDHPLVGALHRLRGRVNPILLDREPNVIGDNRPKKDARPSTPINTIKDSGFVAPQRGMQRSSSQHLPSPDLDKILTPRQVSFMHEGTQQNHTSLRVNPSSGTPRAVDHKPFIQGDDYDSDIQILESDPFTSQEMPSGDIKVFPCPMKGKSNCEKMFTALTSAGANASTHANSRARCTYSGCEKMISLADPGILKAHLMLHERDRTISSSLRNFSNPKYHRPIPSTIPNSQSSSVEPNLDNAIANPGVVHSAVKEDRAALFLTRITIDPSYEFSDEEDFARPAVRRIPCVSEENSSTTVPVEVTAVPTEPALSAEKARKIYLPATKSQAETRRIHADNVPTPSAPTELPDCSKVIQSDSIEQPEGVQQAVFKNPIVTPQAKQKPGKSYSSGSLEAEDYDELSLGPDGFVMISSRLRSNPRPLSASDGQVKIEGNDVRGTSVLPIRKRRYSAHDGIDDIDELNADGPIGTLMLGQHSYVKQEKEDARPMKSNRPILKPKKVQLKRKTGNMLASQPTIQDQTPLTPAKNKQKLTQVSTPINLAEERNPNASIGLDVSLPFASGIASSSPTIRVKRPNGLNPRAGSPLLGLLTAARQVIHSRTVKQEEDEGIFKTPGGTYRRCGEDGLACGRPFCFTCGSAIVGS